MIIDNINYKLSTLPSDGLFSNVRPHDCMPPILKMVSLIQFIKELKDLNATCVPMLMDNHMN